MPDEFPTLEVVAFIGVVAALVRVFQLRSSLREIPELGRALEAALRAGNLSEARALTSRAEGATFVRIGSALVELLGRDPRPSERELDAAVTQARRRASAAAQRGRARDLVVAAVLIGAAAYATRAALGVGQAFYAMLGGALVVTALGPVLRRAMLDAALRATDGLANAASAYLRHTADASRAPCPECGNLESFHLGAPALDAVSELGLNELSICRHCGLVRGRVERPETITVDESRGVRLRAPEPELRSIAAPDHEHEG